MKQLRSFADERLVAGCVHCGGSTETRDHVPSRILLDEPYPENLPVVPACAACNESFSLDEEYLACLIECVLTGSVDAVQRPKIKRILQTKPGLRAKLSQARTVTTDGLVTFAAEQQRVNSVILKLARGHAAFELSEPQHGPPHCIHCVPLMAFDENVRKEFESPPPSLLSVWPEIGSRAMQRLLVADSQTQDFPWLDVQAGRYRYFVVTEGTVLVRIVVSEYLACEVLWET